MENLSVIIVTYNSSKEIGSCLDSLTAHTDCEIIIVDNASTDNTVDIIKSKNDVRLITNATNRGFSAACNQGVLCSNGRYIVLLNPDTRVYPFWAERMQAHFTKKVGAVGPLSTNCIGYQSAYLYYKTKSEQELHELVLMNSGAHEERKLIIGFCLMIRRSTLDRIGFLDENLFLGNDDLELCWRLRCYGYKCIVAHDAFIAHDMQKSFASNPNSTRLVQESTDALYNKLLKYFNGNVPSAMDIWGIDWFKPSQLMV